MTANRMLEVSNRPGIYVHIPFCVRKCNYCAFLSSPESELVKQYYVEALIKEIKHRAMLCNLKEFDTVYFGGGTPTTLKAEQLRSILKAIEENFHLKEDAEYTIEANPGTVTAELLSELRSMGFNRLSMGVQSMNDDRLKFLGRIHSAEDVRRDYELAREAGFENINLDIIFSVPGETTEDALEDIREIVALGPEHISFYSLQLEEGTKFFEMWEKGYFEETPDEVDRETYHKGSELLAELGYERYEISNFAKPGYESRHNSKYWNMAEYAGLGLGASGMIQPFSCDKNWRYQNTSDMETYCELLDKGKTPEAEEHWNSGHDDLSEAIFTGLRRSGGITYSELGGSREDFWSYYEEVREEAEEFASNGFLIIDDDGLRLTEAGVDISNRIMALFV